MKNFLTAEEREVFVRAQIIAGQAAQRVANVTGWGDTACGLSLLAHELGDVLSDDATGNPLDGDESPPRYNTVIDHNAVAPF